VHFIQSIRKYGEIVQIYLGPRPVYVLNSPQAVRHVLVTEAEGVHRGRVFEKSRIIFGDGLITSNDPLHRQQRRLIQPVMQQSKIAAYVESMHEQVEAMSRQWQDGQLVDIRKPFKDMSFRIVASALFRTEVAAEVIDDLGFAMQFTLKGLYSRVLLPDWVEHIPIINRRYRNAVARIRSIADTIIASHGAPTGLGSGAAGCPMATSSQTDKSDLLSMLLSARDPETGEGMSRTQVRNEILSFLLAGSETTAESLAWLFYEVTRNPLVEERIVSEIDRVLGERTITSTDIDKLTFTHQVIHESLRMYPPIWQLSRLTTRALQFKGMELPSGSDLLVSPFSIQRDSTLYLKPSDFNPDRWNPNDNSTRDTFLAFGTGHHVCIGNHFALTEMSVIVATILSKWRMHPAGTRPVRMIPGITLKPSHVVMRLERRQ
jgi:cytochrome P450